MPAVWRLDRLGRSLKHLIELMVELEGERIGFQSVTESRARRESSRYRSLTGHRDLSTMTSVRIPCVLKVGSWGQLGVS